MSKVGEPLVITASHSPAPKVKPCLVVRDSNRHALISTLRLAVLWVPPGSSVLSASHPSSRGGVGW